LTGAGAFLCRDCCARGADPAKRCDACGSPRLIDLGAAADLFIAHVDCDAFYASIEKRDNPSLRDKPVIVGGGGGRGVVSTACYIARTCGVRSAMPMAEARRLCPNAIIIAPRMREYSAAGKRIRELMTELTPAVEPLSIDEAFLDLTGCEAVHGAPAAESLARLAKRVEVEVGVGISIGLAPNKYLAKIASDMEKPRGFTVLPRDKVLAILAPMDVGRMWGVGAVARAKLVAAGIERIGDIQRMNEEEAMRRIGDQGRRLWRLARGIDERTVEARQERKGVSTETTFEGDIGDFEELCRHLLDQAERLALRLRRDGMAARTISLKLRRKNFQLVTRTRSVSDPVSLAPQFVKILRPVLRTMCDGAKFRLLGIMAADLTPLEPGGEAGLFVEDTRKSRAREDAIEALRDRFGRKAVIRGPLYRGP
jgi:DNA polymerase IV